MPVHKDQHGEKEKLIAALRELFALKTVMEWLERPNPAFGDLSPIQLISGGRADRVWQSVFEMKAGTHV